MPPRRPLKFDPIAEASRQWEARGFVDAVPGSVVVTSIMRVQQIYLARVHDALTPEGLTFAQFEALAMLWLSRTGRLPLTKIVERLQVHPASVTNVMDRLEQKQLVRRLPHPTDQRQTLAAITRRGRNVAARASDALNEQVFADPWVTPEAAATLASILTEIRKRAGDFTDLGAEGGSAQPKRERH